MGPLPPVAGMAPPVNLRPEDYLDVRDALSNFVGKGYIGTGDDNARAMYSMLRSTLGPEAAQKMLMHMSIYNQRPDVLKLSPEDRVKQFYDMGSKDSAIQDILSRTGNLGQGVIPGLREAPQVLASDLNNKRWYSSDNNSLAAPSSLSTLKAAAGKSR